MVVELMYNIVIDDVLAHESEKVIELYDIYKYEKEDCIRNPNAISCEHCKHVPGYHTMVSLLNQLSIEIHNEMCVKIQLKHATTLFVLLKLHPEIIIYNANLRDTLICKAREFKLSPAADRKTKKLFNDFVRYANNL
jgi:hypothetical protein